MYDDRIKITCFTILSVLYSFAPAKQIMIIIFTTGLVVFPLNREFVKNLSVILISSFAIMVVGIIAWIISPELSVTLLLINFIRWICLIIISVLFFSSINLHAFVASLVFFKVPVKIALSFGIGVRFLPIIMDEASKVVRIQHQNGFRISLKSLRQVGFVNMLDRLISPILISMLRKAESITISVSIQQLESRIKNYRFERILIGDIYCLIYVVLIVIISISDAIYFNFFDVHWLNIKSIVN